MTPGRGCAGGGGRLARGRPGDRLAVVACWPSACATVSRRRRRVDSDWFGERLFGHAILAGPESGPSIEGVRGAPFDLRYYPCLGHTATSDPRESVRGGLRPMSAPHRPFAAGPTPRRRPPRARRRGRVASELVATPLHDATHRAQDAREGGSRRRRRCFRGLLPILGSSFSDRGAPCDAFPPEPRDRVCLGVHREPLTVGRPLQRDPAGNRIRGAWLDHTGGRETLGVWGSSQPAGRQPVLGAVLGQAARRGRLAHRAPAAASYAIVDAIVVRADV